MTIESSSGEDRTSTSPRLSQPGLNPVDQVDDQEISDVLGTLHDHVDHDPSTNVLENTSHSHTSGANGSATTIEVVQPPMTSHSSSNTAATSRNVNSIRKTLAKWLRLQRPNSKNDEVKKQNHGRSRYKLTGWPPRWVRRRSQSPELRSQQKQRALPPVPQATTTTTAGVAASGSEDVDRPAPGADERDRRSTPDPIRPEDFPPGVAYLPDGDDFEDEEEFNSKSNMIDFASTIKTVKNCDWYWGPISGDAAEQVLQYEPDGSFLVRDSSDDRHIFSLTFKLNGTVRHVRIEHDQGNFSFGSFTRFKSHTIVDFVENAVEHSRSGRYLFFLNRRLPNGPMRVQLLHPVSRVKKVQSLQHMCRFVILKLVPRDHVDQLPVPKQIKDYLKTPNYYSETYIEEAEEEVTAEIVTDIANLDINMPNNDDEPSETIVEATEEPNTNEMYLDANIIQADQVVQSSNVQVNHVDSEAVVDLDEADRGQEDQQQEKVTSM